MCVVRPGWLGSRAVINDGDVPRELAGLVVSLAGSLEATEDLFLPYPAWWTATARWSSR